MSEFLLVFRRENKNDEEKLTDEQKQASVRSWQDWIGGIAARNKLAKQPQRWSTEGRVVKKNDIVTDGPYAEIKEAIGGLIFIHAKDFDEAVEIAKGCPILQAPWNGHVEVRMAVSE